LSDIWEFEMIHSVLWFSVKDFSVFVHFATRFAEDVVVTVL
jgi:hypothetical protein